MEGMSFKALGGGFAAVLQEEVESFCASCVTNPAPADVATDWTNVGPASIALRPAPPVRLLLLNQALPGEKQKEVVKATADHGGRAIGWRQSSNNDPSGG